MDVIRFTSNYCLYKLDFPMCLKPNTLYVCPVYVYRITKMRMTSKCFTEMQKIVTIIHLSFSICCAWHTYMLSLSLSVFWHSSVSFFMLMAVYQVGRPHINTLLLHPLFSSWKTPNESAHIQVERACSGQGDWLQD